MKKRNLFIIVLIALTGSIAFGFIEEPKEVEQPAISINCTDTWVADAKNSFSEIEPEKPNQDLMYDIRGRYSRSVTADKLKKANAIIDLDPNYPTNSITDYISVEVSSTANNKEVKAVSSNDVFSIEQKNILNSVDLSADVLINVKYRAKSPITSEVEDREMEVSMTLIPDVEAEYIGGHKQMINYLEENGLNKIPEMNIEQIQGTSVLFTINEKGKVENVVMSETTGEPGVDKLLLKLIGKMPKWKPAENADGSYVKQNFKFDIGLPGC